MSDFVAIPEPETPEYPEQVKMIMPGEFAAGGAGSPENVQAHALAMRTQWLKSRLEALQSAIPGTEEYDAIMDQIENIIGELKALELTKVASRVEHLERTSGDLALNLRDLAWRLEMENLYGGYDGWWLEDFLSTGELDMTDVEVTSVVPGDDSIDVGDLSSVIVGLNYTLTDGIAMEEVRIKSTATAGSVKRVILENAVTKQYRSGKARLLRTSAAVREGSAVGAGTDTSRTWAPKVTWQGVGGMVPVNLALGTNQGNAAAFTASGDIGFSGDLVTLV